MVYTFTPNPSLDYMIKMLRLTHDVVNRSLEEKVIAGGKGLNVARMLKAFDVPVKVLAVTAGYAGKWWTDMVRSEGIDVQCVELAEGETRINVKLTGVENTEINARGPLVPTELKPAIYDMINQVKDGDILVICGMGTPDMRNVAYANMVDLVADRDVKVIIDSSGESMRLALPKCPYLIKPNLRELEDLGNTSIDSPAEALDCMERIIRMGTRNVLMSMGQDGALWVGEDGVKLRAFAPKGREINAVGAGDSMLAAFIYAMINKMEVKEAFRLSVAAGSATAFSEGFVTRDEVYALLDRVTVEERL